MKFDKTRAELRTRVGALEDALREALTLPARVQSFQIITKQVDDIMKRLQTVLDDKAVL